MPEFLTLVAAYYLCSNTAVLRVQTANEAALCGAIYEQVKLQFDPEMQEAGHDTSERLRRNRAAYLAFKSWEQENAALVDRLKEETRPVPSRHRAPLRVLPRQEIAVSLP